MRRVSRTPSSGATARNRALRQPGKCLRITSSNCRISRRPWIMPLVTEAPSVPSIPVMRGVFTIIVPGSVICTVMNRS